MSFVATYSGPGEAGARCAIDFNPSQHVPTAVIKGFMKQLSQQQTQQPDPNFYNPTRRNKEKHMSFVATYSGPGVERAELGDSITGEAGARCAIGFNPSQHVPTAVIKGFMAAAMQSVINERNNTQKPSAGASHVEISAYSAAMRCFATALTQLETAQMFAVKGFAYGA